MAKSNNKNAKNKQRLEKAVLAYVENQNKHVNRLYRTHIPAVNKLFREVGKDIIDDFINEYGDRYTLEEIFKFGDNGFSYRTNQRLRIFQQQLIAFLFAAIRKEWNIANTNTDSLVRAVFPDISKDKISQYYLHNEKALTAFLNRNLSSDKSRTISGRVWKITNQFKRDIEDTIAIGIQNGDSGAVLAKRLNKYLQKPSQKNIDIEKLTNKKVRSELEQRQNNKPEGQGVYNSSYKNARRLAANETNLAYRNAEAERIKQLDFVVGFEIKVSNSHADWLRTVWIPKHGSKPEICDVLAGKYPKEFIWNSWHVQCKCFRILILKTWEEIQEDNIRILRSEEVSKNSVNSVKTMPKSFDRWVGENSEKVKKSNSKPYFWEDNKGIIDKTTKR